MGKRYKIKYGSYGVYFYDSQSGKDLTLEEVLYLLNYPEVSKIFSEWKNNVELRLSILENAATPEPTILKKDAPPEPKKKQDQDPSELYTNKNWLYKQYITLGKSAAKIGKEVGCDQTTIYNWLGKFKIKKRKTQTPVKPKLKEGNYSELKSKYKDYKEQEEARIEAIKQGF